MRLSWEYSGIDERVYFTVGKQWRFYRFDPVELRCGV